MNRLEWKEATKEYKTGYIIGSVLIFFLGLISCLLSFFFPITAIFLVIGFVILRLILNKRYKKRKRINNE